MLKGKEALRKNLLRVKQLADQGLGRAEKSEVLSEDLISAEKKVECLKQICTTTTKKMAAIMQTGSTASDSEKKLKKVPENVMALAFEENANVLGEGILSDVFNSCAQGHYSLGKDVVEYERQTESTVLNYLQDLLDNDIPLLQKTKRNLAKLTLDMDSARTRYLASQKQATGTKTDSLKEEMEDASIKVDQCKDQYATEVYTFIAKEAEICTRLVEWLEAEATYYKNATRTLDELIPKLKDDISRYSTKPLFGTPLEEHLKNTDRDIAIVIETCICTLVQIAMDEEGLFRIAGSASKMKKLLAAFNAGTVDMFEYVTDVHAIAGVLKQYLRELPEPLLTFALHNEWLRTANIKDHEQRMRHLWTIIQKLPKANFMNLRYLIKFLAKLADNSDVNKMSSNNIAIVIGPNLLWAQEELGPNVLNASIQSLIVETIITHHNYFFPGDIDFSCTLQEVSTLHSSSAESGSTDSLDARVCDTTADQSSEGGSSAAAALQKIPVHLSTPPSKHKDKKPKERPVAATGDPAAGEAVPPSASKGIGKLRHFLKGPAPGAPGGHARKSSYEYLEFGSSDEGSVSLISIRPSYKPSTGAAAKRDESIFVVAEATVDLDSPTRVHFHEAPTVEKDIEFIDSDKSQSSDNILTKRDSVLALAAENPVQSMSPAVAIGSINGSTFGLSSLSVITDMPDFKMSPKMARTPSKKHAPPIPPRVEGAASSSYTRAGGVVSGGRPVGPPPAVPPCSPPTSPSAASDGTTAQPSYLGKQPSVALKAPQTAPPGVPTSLRTDLGPPPPPPRSQEQPSVGSDGTVTSLNEGGAQHFWKTAGHARTPSGEQARLSGHARTPSGDQARLPSGGEHKVPPPIPERKGSRSEHSGDGGDRGDASPERRGPERSNSMNKETML